MQKRGTEFRERKDPHATVVDVDVPPNFGSRHNSVNLYHIPCPDKTLSKIENNKKHAENIMANNTKKTNQAA